MARLPTWEAVPGPVSQSPPPQSQAEFTSPGSSSSSSRARIRLPCACPTNSPTKSGSMGSFSSMSSSLPSDCIDNTAHRASWDIWGGIGYELTMGERNDICPLGCDCRFCRIGRDEVNAARRPHPPRPHLR